MKIVFLGSPGVGKGTYADILSRYYKIPHISTGNIFRAMKHDNTELGKKVKALIEAGQFVDDKTTLKVIDDRLSNPDCKNGYILDGFPRTLYQAKHFIDIDTVLNFDANEKRIIERLSGRRTCLNKSCQAIYHIKNNPPKIKDTCDRCGGSLVQRKDERPEIIKERHLKVGENVEYQLFKKVNLKSLLGVSKHLKIDAQKAKDELRKEW